MKYTQGISKLHNTNYKVYSLDQRKNAVPNTHSRNRSNGFFIIILLIMIPILWNSVFFAELMLKMSTFLNSSLSFKTKHHLNNFSKVFEIFRYITLVELLQQSKFSSPNISKSVRFIENLKVYFLVHFSNFENFKLFWKMIKNKWRLC